MEQPRLKVETVPTSALIPYANNAKIHTDKQVEEIAASIQQFGFSDPVGVWTRPDGQLEIVEGHGRVLAAEKAVATSWPLSEREREIVRSLG